MDLSRFTALDAELVEAARPVKVLSNLAWPVSEYDRFLSAWKSGNPHLPKIPARSLDYSKNKAVLRSIMDRAERTHPVGDYIFRTAESYHSAAMMLENMGQPSFTELSGQIYGLPEQAIGSGSLTSLNAAEHFIETTGDFLEDCKTSEYEYCVMPSAVAEALITEIEQFFGKGKVAVVIDPDLSSKAAAGASRIRIRGSTCFAPKDIPQLLHHEVFVHTVTMLNGREQPFLKSMGLGAPRTTRTQEGLALFAELITTSIDVARLRRIALRVKAVQLGMDGADFIDIFKLFLDSGQNEQESYQSAMRVFRGGDVAGRIVCTKDCVYLGGLIFIHTFLRKAISQGKIFFPHYLFAGRLTLGDVVALEEFFKSGYIALPEYEPKWIVDRPSLTAFLVYSAFADRINLSTIQLGDFSARDL